MRYVTTILLSCLFVAVFPVQAFALDEGVGQVLAVTKTGGSAVEVELQVANYALYNNSSVEVFTPAGRATATLRSSGTHVLWDAHRNLIWQAGLSGSTLMFDPAKGTSEPLWCPENERDYFGIACLKPGAWGNNGLPMERGLWMHPTDPEYLFVVNLSMIIRVHLMSGTSEIFSY